MDNYNITPSQEKNSKICDKLIYIDDFQKRKSISDYYKSFAIAKKENYYNRLINKN